MQGTSNQWGARNLMYLASCGALLACFLYGALNLNVLRLAENDFLNFYTGAALAGTPGLYSTEASLQAQKQLSPREFPALQKNVRLPFYYLLLKPLTLLPFRTAHLVFQFITCAAFAAFVLVYRNQAPGLPLFAALSLPLVANINNGQDAILVTAIAGVGMLLATRKHDFAAGIVLSLCAIKIHLFLLLPLAVVRHRRWTLLKGALAGGAVLLLMSFAAAGPDWPVDWLRSASDPAANPTPFLMPTVQGLAASFGWPPVVSWLMVAVVVVLSVVAMLRAKTFERSTSVALIGSLLVSYHAYVQDAAVLLLAAALLLAEGIPRLTRGVLTAALLPPVYYIMIDGPPWNGVLHALLFLLLLLLAR